MHDRIAPGEGPARLRHRPGCPAHRLHASADVDARVSSGDGPGCLHDRLETAAAEPVDGRPGDLRREARKQERHPGHVAVVLACLVTAPEVDVANVGGRDAGSFQGGGEHHRREVVGPDRRERPPVPADGGPHGFDDPCLGHCLFQVLR